MLQTTAERALETVGGTCLLPSPQGIAIPIPGQSQSLPKCDKGLERGELHRPSSPLSVICGS